MAARTGSIHAGFRPAAPFLVDLLSHEAWHVVLPAFLCSPIPNPHPNIHGNHPKTIQREWLVLGTCSVPGVLLSLILFSN